jgi:hypothetical protein
MNGTGYLLAAFYYLNETPELLCYIILYLKERMSSIADKDTYGVYTGIEDGAATFALFDDGGIVGRTAMAPEDLPVNTENGDHFWVEIEDGDIVELQFDPELTAQSQEEAQDAVETHRKMQELGRQELNDDDE